MKVHDQYELSDEGVDRQVMQLVEKRMLNLKKQVLLSEAILFTGVIAFISILHFENRAANADLEQRLQAAEAHRNEAQVTLE